MAKQKPNKLQAKLEKATQAERQLAETDLKAVTGKIREAEVKANLVALETALETGALLVQGQEALARTGRMGQFDSWVESLGFSRRTASNRIGVYETFGALPLASLGRFDVTALYELGESKTSQRAVEEAIKLASRGERVTRQAALDLIEKHSG
jgi:hypothetical protein